MEIESNNPNNELTEEEKSLYQLDSSYESLVSSSDADDDAVTAANEEEPNDQVDTEEVAVEVVLQDDGMCTLHRTYKKDIDDKCR